MTRSPKTIFSFAKSAGFATVEEFLDAQGQVRAGPERLHHIIIRAEFESEAHGPPRTPFAVSMMMGMPLVAGSRRMSLQTSMPSISGINHVEG